MGLDVARLLDQADEMVHACAACVPAEENPGAVLGVIMGVLAAPRPRQGHAVVSPGIAGARRLARAAPHRIAPARTGAALLSVDGEPLGAPGVYGDDRLFVYLRLESAPDAAQDAAVAALEAAGHPVRPHRGRRAATTSAASSSAGSSRRRWPAPCSASTRSTSPTSRAPRSRRRKLTAEYEKTGALAPETPLRQGDGLTLFADARNAAELDAASRDKTAGGGAEGAPGPRQARRLRRRCWPSSR